MRFVSKVLHLSFWHCGLSLLTALMLIGSHPVDAAPSTDLGAVEPYFTFIEAGGFHVCVLTASGGVLCWGNNMDGQLGDGTFINRSAPLAEVSLPGGATAIAAGRSHTCALASDGRVWCWGSNRNGQAGVSSKDIPVSNTPVEVNGLSDVTAISAGYSHTCAITGGEVKCWGANESGQLGNGSNDESSTPVSVSGLPGEVIAIAAGEAQTCASVSAGSGATSGSVMCWGADWAGQLGDGSSTASSIPVQVAGLDAGVDTISAGDQHTCAHMDSASGGGWKCWGAGGSGRLGNGDTLDKPTPVDISSLGDSVAVAGGFSHACSLTSSGGVICWGWNYFGQLGNGSTSDSLSPVQVSDLSAGVSSITSGDSFACALMDMDYGGGVKCWGINSDGQLGNNERLYRSGPAYVTGLPTDTQAVFAGNRYSCVLTRNGYVRCWGSNYKGLLGDGTTLDRSTPVLVSGIGTGVETVSTGGNHVCALVSGSDGASVKCWGDNALGQLGNATTTSSLTPVDVSGLDEGVVAIAAGGYHTCAALNASHGFGVKCWGYNGSGALGDGTTTNRLTPVSVSGLGGVEITALSAGAYHTCARTASGAVKCWGSNTSGELGDGTQQNYRTSPVNVSGLASGVTAIVSGQSSTCALVGGGVKCWGSNSEGLLGDGTNTDRLTPVNVSGLVSGVAQISSGLHHACAMLSDGGLKVLGINTFGELGDGTATNRNAPVTVAGLPESPSAVSAGGNHTCALLSTKDVACWGLNDAGQLGDETKNTGFQPVMVKNLYGSVWLAAASGYHACAAQYGGAMYCWGDNWRGQLGDGTNNQSSQPVFVNSLSNVKYFAAGEVHTCAVTSAGAVKCWGDNYSGQLGDGTTDVHYSPVDVSGLASIGAGYISAGSQHTCVAYNGAQGNGVKCWGSNSNGQLGDSSMNDRYTPVTVTGVSSVKTIALGSSHSCALTYAGAVKCWGANGKGQLGNGSYDDSSTPVVVIGLTSGVQAIVAGNEHTCAVTSAGAVKCWGANFSNQLGDESYKDQPEPVNVIGLESGFKSVAAGNGHTCALANTGAVKCWGANGFGQLGDGSRVDRGAPVDVVGVSSASSIVAGRYYTCAVIAGSGMQCWGQDSSGQLGLGASTWSSLPVDVFLYTAHVSIVIR